MIAIEPLSPFEGFETQYDEILGRLRTALSEIASRAKRVYLLLIRTRSSPSMASKPVQRTAKGCC